MTKPWSITTAVFGISLLFAPVIAAGQAASPPSLYGPPGSPNNNVSNGPNNGPAGRPDSNIMPGPGMVNYVEGAVYLNGLPLGRNSIGNAAMDAGALLETHQGKAEILLTPGIFLRVDDHSTVKMISPYITPTKIEVLRGRAAVEVDQLLKQNVMQVVDHGVSTQLVKTGYYEFNANNGQVRVFKGQAEVEYAPGKWAEVKGEHQMALEAGVRENEAKFQPNPAEDQLMQWSKLRSQYLAQANEQMAPAFYGRSFYPGWYWDPYMWNYTFIGDGPFYSPFGWGFYPLGWGWGGWYGGFYGGPGFYGGVDGGFRGGMGGGRGGRGGR